MRKVEIAEGYNQIVLPNGYVYDEGEQADLTSSEFEKIPEDLIGESILDLGLSSEGSVDLSGEVDVTGTVAVSGGAITSAQGAPNAANQAWPVKVVSSSGNVADVDSNGAVRLQSGGTPGSAVPNRATQVGGSDGTNLRSLKVDASGNQYTILTDGTDIADVLTGDSGQNSLLIAPSKKEQAISLSTGASTTSAVDCSNYRYGSFQLAVGGTVSVTLEGSNDNSIWVTLLTKNAQGITTGASTNARTTAGIYEFSVPCRYIRFNVTVSTGSNTIGLELFSTPQVPMLVSTTGGSVQANQGTPGTDANAWPVKLTDGTTEVSVLPGDTGQNSQVVVPARKEVTQTISGNASGATIDCSNYRFGSFQVTLVGSATVIVQGSNDNTNWSTLLTRDISASISVSAATTGRSNNVVYEFNIPCRYLRVTTTGYIAPASTITIELFAAPQVPMIASVTNAGGTVAATQSGTWTVQPGNTQNTTAWLVQTNNSFSHITTATTTNVKGSSGHLHALCVGTGGTGSTATLYDSTSASGSIIGVFDTGTMRNIVLDIALLNGLTVVTSGGTPADITVAYK